MSERDWENAKEGKRFWIKEKWEKIRLRERREGRKRVDEKKEKNNESRKTDWGNERKYLSNKNKNEKRLRKEKLRQETEDFEKINFRVTTIMTIGRNEENLIWRLKKENEREVEISNGRKRVRRSRIDNRN